MAERSGDSGDHPSPAGVLYVCGMPIGNWEDVTLRLLRVLKEVDYIAAEDTENTGALLRHYGVTTPVDYYASGPRSTEKRILQRLLAGEKVALLANTGTPNINEGGARLARLAQDAGAQVVPIPGPSALTAAISAAGIAAHQFCFVGFLPRDGAERLLLLRSLAARDDAVVLFAYGPPRRIRDTLQELQGELGNREAAVMWELTTEREAIIRGQLDALPTRLTGRTAGRATIVVAGASAQQGRADG